MFLRLHSYRKLKPVSESGKLSFSLCRRTNEKSFSIWNNDAGRSRLIVLLNLHKLVTVCKLVYNLLH